MIVEPVELVLKAFFIIGEKFLVLSWEVIPIGQKGNKCLEKLQMKEGQASRTGATCCPGKTRCCVLCGEGKEALKLICC